VSKGDTGAAIVLRTAPLGEADLLVVLLTETLGKVHAAAHSARRSRRRFPGGLSTGTRGEASIARGRGSLLRLERLVPTTDHTAIGRDLTRLAYVAYLCEITDELILEQQRDDRSFERLWVAIEHTVTQAPHAGVLRQFELGILETLGLLPALDRCCACGASVLGDPDARDVAFDGERGGALCELHAGGASRADRQVLLAAVQLLRDPGDGTADRAGDPGEAVVRDPAAPALEALDHAPADQRKALRDLTFSVLRHHLRRPLRSAEFFAQIRGAE
jgi:DNA repair protein RecO (recombination protein O)